MEKKEKEHKKNANEELITKLNKDNAELQEKNLRLQAEMQNIIRRNNEDITKMRKYDGEDIIINILQMVDNFERAIKLDDSDLTDELSKFLSGFKMIYGNFVNYLKSIEVNEIEALNNPFDPNKMEAVSVEECEGIAAGTVVDIFQKGYMYKDKVIRPCMVKVAK